MYSLAPVSSTGGASKCGYRIMAIMLDFQSRDEVSTTSTRSRRNLLLQMVTIGKTINARKAHVEVALDLYPRGCRFEPVCVLKVEHKFVYGSTRWYRLHRHLCESSSEAERLITNQKVGISKFLSRSKYGVTFGVMNRPAT